MNLVLSTGSLYSYGLDRVFALAAETGFDGVEVLIDGRWDARQPDYLWCLMQGSGLPIPTVHAPFFPWVQGWPRDELGRLERSADVARAVGAGVVVAHLPLRFYGLRVELVGLSTGPRMLPIRIPRRNSFGRFLREDLPAFEAAQGVRVGVENMPARLFLGRRANLYAMNDVEVLAGLPHLTLDTTHVGTWGWDLLAVYERLKERIVHVHLSNFDGQEHRRPDTGYLPLDRLLQRLARDRYEGAVSLELGPDVLEAEDESKVLAHLRRAVTFCREHLAGQEILAGEPGTGQSAVS
ncbi:MAG TPA: sugar phosphate isomerase/epimerase [Anaerolineae bacterium]|nr:sugar phosphate isomerase/epimerase [Anaerolineae bacterium]